MKDRDGERGEKAVLTHPATDPEQVAPAGEGTPQPQTGPHEVRRDCLPTQRALESRTGSTPSWLSHRGKLFTHSDLPLPARSGPTSTGRRGWQERKQGRLAPWHAALAGPELPAPAALRIAASAGQATLRGPERPCRAAGRARSGTRRGYFRSRAHQLLVM